MKIAVYSICKDERQHVDQFMKSAQDADMIVVADTGSTDGTQTRLHDFGTLFGYSVVSHDISIHPWRFDTARNVALALVPPWIDVCIRLDLDERLEPGWREAIEAAWTGPVNQLWYDFQHCPGYTFKAKNIHARHGFIWRGLDHEGLYPAYGHQAIAAHAKLQITHHQDHSKNRSNILPRLEAAVSEDPRARNWWYLGREYYYYKQFQNCIDTLKRYLECPDATWASERMAAMCMIADCQSGEGYPEKAIQWYYRAAGEYHTREPFFGLAQMLVARKRYSEALPVIRLAQACTNKLDTLHQNPAAWNGTLEQLADLCELYNPQLGVPL